MVGGSAAVNGHVFVAFRLTEDSSPKLATITINDGTAQRSMVTSLKVHGITNRAKLYILAICRSSR